MGVPTVVFVSLCVIAALNGLWLLVAVALAAGLLVWIRESGPDDPEPLERRQVDGAANGRYRR